MPSPYDQTGYLAGTLPPMGQAGAITGSPAQIQAGYQQAYGSALGQNQANYANILQGFQQTAAGQRTEQDAIASGYPQLAARIQGRLGGLDQATATLQGSGNAVNQGYGQVGQQVHGYLGWLGSGGLADQYSRHTNIAAGYRGLESDVMGDIAGLGREQDQQIRDNYAVGSSNVRQGAINRGLGNTTVQDSLQRGVEFDRARAQNDLSERMMGLRASTRTNIRGQGLGYEREAAQTELGQQNLIAQSNANAAMQLGQSNLGFQAQNARDVAGSIGNAAQTRAGYEAQTGLAGLNYGERANQANSALAQNQLGWMNSVSAPYPNAGAYMQAAQMSGMAEAARAAQDQFSRSQIGLPPGGGSAAAGGMTMVPGTGRGVPSSNLSLGGGGYPAAGGGGSYFSGGNAPIIGSTGQIMNVPTASYAGADLGLGALAGGGAMAAYGQQQGQQAAQGALLGGLGLAGTDTSEWTDADWDALFAEEGATYGLEGDYAGWEDG